MIFWAGILQAATSAETVTVKLESLKAKRQTMKVLRQRSAEGRLMVCAQECVKACREGPYLVVELVV